MTTAFQSADQSLAERINAGCTCARAGLCWHCEFAREVERIIVDRDSYSTAMMKEEREKLAALADRDRFKQDAAEARAEWSGAVAALRSQLDDADALRNEAIADRDALREIVRRLVERADHSGRPEIIERRRDSITVAVPNFDDIIADVRKALETPK